MSTTMLSASRVGRRNVASTTKVAPCSRWAGPKTSPRKLWATIMWSRTVTLNIGYILVVGRRCGTAPAGDRRRVARHGVGQVGEGRRPGDEGVEGGILAAGPARAPAGRAIVRVPRRAGETMPTWLARMAKPAASGRRRRGTSVTSVSPYQLRSSTVPSRREQVQGAAAGRPTWRWCARRGPGRRWASAGSAKSTPSASATVAARVGVDVDEGHLDAGHAAEQQRDTAADHARADHGDAVADEGRRVPQRVDGGLDGAGQHGAHRRARRPARP